MKPYRQILREVGDAVDYVRAKGGSVPWNAVAEQLELGKQLADLPDDATNEDWFDSELPSTLPNVVRVATVEEFALVYKALGYVHNCVVYQHMIDKDIGHEEAHKARVDFVGFRQSVLSLTVTDSVVKEIRLPNNTFTEVSFEWNPSIEPAGPLGNVTKLAVAAIVAGPYKLSDGDKVYLNAMGYQGQADVARRILTATDPHLSSLPLPENF